MREGECRGIKEEWSDMRMRLKEALAEMGSKRRGEMKRKGGGTRNVRKRGKE